MNQEWFDFYVSQKFTATLSGYSGNLANQAKTIQEMNYSNHILCRRMQEEFNEIRSLNDLEDFLGKYKRLTNQLVDDYVAKNNYMQRVMNTGNTFGLRLYELSDELYNISNRVSEEEKTNHPNLKEEQIVALKKEKSFQIADQHLEDNKGAYRQFVDAVMQFETAPAPNCSLALEECSDMISAHRIISRFSAMGYNESEIEDTLYEFGNLNTLLNNLGEIKRETNKYYRLMEDEYQGLYNMKKADNLVHEFHKEQLQLMDKQTNAEFTKK